MDFSNEFEQRFLKFHDLMKFRVRNILLVSTPYDGYVLDEDGLLAEKVFDEFLDLKIHDAPRIIQVSSAIEAFETLEKKHFDLIITMSRIGDMDAFEFCHKIKELNPNRPVVMLSNERFSTTTIAQIRENKSIDRVFYWAGDSKILLAIIKHVEDTANVENDCKQGVRVILVVEDSSWYYSQFLPIIYIELMKQTRYLVSHAVNEKHRLLRVRARPKIILAETYEEASLVISKYKNNLLGIISDVGFPKDNELNTEAGLSLAKEVGAEIPGLPFLLHSEEDANSQKAREMGVYFLNKNSPNLLLDIRNYILETYGFGVFVFKYPDGRIIDRASAIEDLERIIQNLPGESLLYHGNNNHFSRWLRARAEFEVADELRTIDTTKFDNVEILRSVILDSLDKFYHRYQAGVILDFGLSKFDMDNSVSKIGNGSLGGKARGVAFLTLLFAKSNIANKYPKLKIKTPRSFVICSESFEVFMESNDLYDFAIETNDENTIAQRFISAKLPSKIEDSLRVLLQNVTYPLAVRSSSILEDSQILPFAGIYKTYVIPNNNTNFEIRFKQLKDAIKLIYASVFYQSPKHYARNADLRIEEERMAILIQQLVGEYHDDTFYPAVSGVAQSYNFYPFSHQKSEEGIVNLALGFGKTIVEGEQAYRFSPEYPQMNPPYADCGDFLKKSQANFYALNLRNSQNQLCADDGCSYEKLDIARSESDGILKYVGSTYSTQENCIYDSLAYKGQRVVSFAPILKYDLFPISDIVKDLFELSKYAFGSDVEIEFAVNIPTDEKKQIEFYLLQVRPMVVGKEAVELNVEQYKKDELVGTSYHTIGNGVYKGIYDVIFVRPETFKINDSMAIASEIGELNRILYKENRKCILIGFGRMGTSEQWLGIPLSWSQMSSAKIVIEVDWNTLNAEPSLGSHFHHNLSSLKMGYFHIENKPNGGEYIDWEWLNNMEVISQGKYVKLARSKTPIVVKIDGRTRTGIIMK